ncbi:MAG: hypothetical protein JSS04_09215 [Proteobacteria bacterium]|nr:hypothetical protein [Pseudomonadota bacterium]
MRLLLASVATLAAVALAAPAFAQDATPAAPTPTPTTTTKHKPATNTAAYCNTLKSASSKSACLKRVHAQNTTPKAGPHKKAKKADTTKAATSASAAPPPAAAPSPPQTVNIPPLPQKTI